MEDDRLAQGFRFYPTEEELVSFYLQKKLEGRRQDFDLVIPVLYIYDFNPWDLPRQGVGCMDASSSSREFAGELCREDPDQWFFFIPRQENEARGGRPNRLTTSGYWKATGSPGYVFSSHNRIIGMKRTMVFYKGRAPSGRKTEWKMNEYRAIEGEPSSSITTIPPLRQEFALCRVYKRAFGNRLPSAAAAATATSDVTVEQAHYGGGGSGGGGGGGGDGGDGGDHANPSQNMAHWQVIAGMLVGLTMKL